ncbi:aminotransferase class I/II-fold pyridoxal phosphate-dependent enzyme [Flexibacterium corallicola]|uniref:aminotransferase class I/II-fold pyridoxal phosphate-dependent enzyme n=1 Tax=Flexibacterium corallicola TaxID=3037259 RepID=UPI00286ECF60|nr:aminotransferase class I/II-fold pyridoxal phosphate-dependent enzyme [Pseudovibrio sp. M1P-2-3]
MNKKTLGKDERDSLINNLRKAGRGGAGIAQRRPSRPKQKFSDLPGFKEMKIQRAAADLLKVDNPFFRAHDGRASDTTHIDGKAYLNFASYDYLGLNGHPEVIEAAKAAADHYGISAGASRVVAGERPIHRALEEQLAKLYGVESAVAFVSGHATNVTVIGQLMEQEGLILHDSYIHNSIVTGAKLSGAVRQSFAHNDYEALERILENRAHRHKRVLIVVEGIYSMDGDFPDLPRLLEIKRKYNAWLMVDEAHSLGILGKTGRGLAEHFGIDPREVDIWMGTFSKTLAGCGGYIAGSQDLVEYLKFSVSGFVFSVGLAPPIAAACHRAAQIMIQEPERVQKAQANCLYFKELCQKAGFDTGESQGYAVVPIMVGDSLKATVLSSRLLDRGVNALPIIFPAVPEKSARLRFFITSQHSKQQLEQAVEAVKDAMADLEANPVTIAQLAKR